MRAVHLWGPVLALAGALALAGCADDYYGVDAGYGYYGDGYYGDCYGPYDCYGPGYGWYDDYYYPGSGIFVFDREGHRHHMRDRDREHWGHRGGGNWQGHGGNWQGHRNWQGGNQSHGNWQGHHNWQGGSHVQSGGTPHVNGGGGHWSGGHWSGGSGNWGGRHNH